MVEHLSSDESRDHENMTRRKMGQIIDLQEQLIERQKAEIAALQARLVEAQQLSVRQANELRRLATSKSQQKRYEVQQS